jgi:EAL domain-containing protein (putative c-di-GMP-specific phosphodiesterase class I)
MTPLVIERETLAAGKHNPFVPDPDFNQAPGLLEIATLGRTWGVSYGDYRRRRQLETARLRRAIDHRELSVHYQPQYQIRGGQNCGVEALARWFLPEGGSIPPSEFVRHAERHGLIKALGARVLHEACTTVAGWRRSGEDLPILCVNVSPRQICGEFCAVLERTLEQTGFPAELLELEITEGILIEQPELVLDCLAQWKSLGVRIALDDFGTGYSSLSYLSRLPVDRLKIDQTLIRRMATDDKTAAIVRTIISLGADLGFAVLAEGVETEAALTMLRGMGCEQAQGFLFAKPACAEEARALLAANWGERSVPRIYSPLHHDAVNSNAC